MRRIDLTAKETYTKVRVWYQRHIHDMPKGLPKDYVEGSKRLILALPLPTEISEFEIKAIMAEVLRGFLEWGFRKSDGEKKMYEYASAVLQGTKLTDTEKSELMKSQLWPYLSPHLRGDKVEPDGNSNAGEPPPHKGSVALCDGRSEIEPGGL